MILFVYDTAYVNRVAIVLDTCVLMWENSEWKCATHPIYRKAWLSTENPDRWKHHWVVKP